MDERDRIYRFYGRIVAALTWATLIAFAAQWFLYLIYLGNDCAGRVLRANWKTSYFCVNPREALLWRVVDNLVPVLFVITFSSVILGKLVEMWRSRKAPDQAP
jgi:hypothetical protein